MMGLNSIKTHVPRLLKNQFLIIEEQEDRRFVNVDMTTSKGLARAKDLNLASS